VLIAAPTVRHFVGQNQTIFVPGGGRRRARFARRLKISRDGELIDRRAVTARMSMFRSDPHFRARNIIEIEAAPFEGELTPSTIGRGVD